MYYRAMELHEYVTYYAFVCATFYAVYRILRYLESENTRLKDRNSLLASYLQTAELRTGVPYYSAISAGAFPGEMSKHFHQTLQDRILNNDSGAPAVEADPSHT